MRKSQPVKKGGKGLLSKEESVSAGPTAGNARWLARSCPRLAPFTVAAEHEAGRKAKAREPMLSGQKVGRLGRGCNLNFAG